MTPQHYTETDDALLCCACENVERGHRLNKDQIIRLCAAWVNVEYLGLDELIIRAACRNAGGKCPELITDAEALHLALEKLIEAKDQDLGPGVDKTKVLFDALASDGTIRRGYVQAEIETKKFI